jgi:hypothetical protein
MEEKISLKEYQLEWQALLQCPLMDRPVLAAYSNQKSENEKDLFDCSSLVIPPKHGQLDLLVSRFSEQWRQLDERRIFAEPSATPNGTDEATSSVGVPYWYERHVRLPERFDYATREDAPPEDDGSGDRIVSLEDPNQDLSYRRALWDLFASVPTAAEVEAEIVSGHKMYHTQVLHDEMILAKREYTPVDGHGLARFRMNDRHGIPPMNRTQQQQQHISTLRLECWRKPPTRRSTPDGNRMVVEFMGSHTLLDVHRTIVELTHDELCLRPPSYGDKEDIPGSKRREHQQSCSGNDDIATYANVLNESSGYFFIEGIFYTTGSVDYVTPIQIWLQKGTNKERTARLAHLGLDESFMNEFGRLPVQSMASARLEDIELRLAMRYLHVHHGDVECSIYATDRRVGRPTSSHYPIVHDDWTNSYTIFDCEACKLRAGSIVTSNSCRITMGNRRLCLACTDQLHLRPSEIEEYSVWKRQIEISMGAADLHLL